MKIGSYKSCVMTVVQFCENKRAWLKVKSLELRYWLLEDVPPQYLVNFAKQKSSVLTLKKNEIHMNSSNNFRLFTQSIGPNTKEDLLSLIISRNLAFSLPGKLPIFYKPLFWWVKSRNRDFFLTMSNLVSLQFVFNSKRILLWTKKK